MFVSVCLSGVGGGVGGMQEENIIFQIKGKGQLLLRVFVNFPPDLLFVFEVCVHA